MRNDRNNQRSSVIAAVVAGLLMAILGFGYRAAAAWLATPVNADPVTQATLDRLPMEIGNWLGQEVPLDPNIIAATDTDACLSRLYFKENANENVSLWVASGVQVRDLMPHRPEVCYVGSGYTLMSNRIVEFTRDSEMLLQCNLMRFSRGTEQLMVLYYYIVDGQYCQDVGQFRYRVFERIGYVTQVQIVTAINTFVGADAAEKVVSDFAVDTAVPLAELFR